jgi:hypothetical protein
MNRYALSFLNRQHSTNLATLVTLDHFTLLAYRLLSTQFTNRTWILGIHFINMALE